MDSEASTHPSNETDDIPLSQFTTDINAATGQVEVEELRSTDNQEDLRSSLRKNPPKKPKHWTPAEDAALKAAIAEFGQKRWKKIAEHVPGRNHTQCLQRWSKVLTPGLKKGQWDTSEDELLISLVLAQTRCKTKEEWLQNKPRIRWGVISKGVDGRTAKQCRERWTNHLNPAIVKGFWTAEEDAAIMKLYSMNPRKWAWIAKKIPGRTENAVKIRWKSLHDASQRGKQRGLYAKKFVDMSSARTRPHAAGKDENGNSWSAETFPMESSELKPLSVTKDALNGTNKWPPAALSSELLAQLVANGVASQANSLSATLPSFVGSPSGISPTNVTSPASSQHDHATQQTLMKIMGLQQQSSSPVAGNLNDQVMQYLMLAQAQQQQQHAQAAALAQALAQSGINLQHALQMPGSSNSNSASKLHVSSAATPKSQNSTGDDFVGIQAKIETRKRKNPEETPSSVIGDHGDKSSPTTQEKEGAISNAKVTEVKNSSPTSETKKTAKPAVGKRKSKRKRPRSAEEDSAADVLRDLQKWV